MQDPDGSPGRWRLGEAATRLGASYKSNREVIEPILRLLADALALAALLRHRPTSPPETAGSVKLP
jgi:DNA-binding IclR family transcriptional regulator